MRRDARSFPPTPSGGSTATDVTRSTANLGGKIDEDPLLIPVRHDFMISRIAFRRACGRLADRVRRRTVSLGKLYDAYPPASGGKGLATSKAFFATLMACYIDAIIHHYPVRLREDPTRARWAPGQPDATKFGEWLYHWLKANPDAHVRVWMEDEAMRVELRLQHSRRA